MKNRFEVQVLKDHYYDDYDTLARFISYYHQIRFARQLNPKNVLEIGIGNKTVSNYLKQHGIKVETCDFDKNLEPDHVADIRNLGFADDSYDLILVCEVLEHIPWKDVDKALSELSRVARKNVIVSIPYSAASFEMFFRFRVGKSIIKKDFFDLFFRMPYFFLKKKFAGEHYWEMGRMNYPKRRVRQLLKKRFKIIEEGRQILDPHRYFFILEV